MISIGIDPGLDGAVAIISPEGVAVSDTPTLNVAGKGGKRRREYNLGAMADTFGPVYNDRFVRLVHVFIENVHAMPGQGVRSMFTMGYGCGAWAGIVAAMDLPMTYVTPQRWKKVMLDGMGKDKDASRLVAMRLFPAVAAQLQRKRDDGRAEALLIAAYGRRAA